MIAAEVTIERDIVYGTALVGHDDPAPRERLLKLDAYIPSGRPDGPRPAVILAFGGAFHRGSKTEDLFEDERGHNTSIAAYCHWLATLGYAAFSIDYRLVQEDPVPSGVQSISVPAEISLARTAYVRELLGLPPATTDMMWRGIESAIDDMVAAFRFVEANHGRWAADPARIAVGGFSAGARIALYAALDTRIPAAAVIALSGFTARSDIERFVKQATTIPPIMFVTGEHDLEHVRAQREETLLHFASVGQPIQSHTIFGAGHFYPLEALTEPGALRLDERIALFLGRAVNPSRAASVPEPLDHFGILRGHDRNLPLLKLEQT